LGLIREPGPLGTGFIQQQAKNPVESPYQVKVFLDFAAFPAQQKSTDTKANAAYLTVPGVPALLCFPIFAVLFNRLEQAELMLLL